MTARLRALLAALALVGLLDGTAMAQESGDTLDAPPGSPSAPGAAEGASDPFSEDTAPGASEASPGDASAAQEAPIPPPPAPTAGYGTPVYPRPAVEAPGFMPADGIRLPSNLATRLRVIDSSLQILSAKGTNGIVDGILSMVSGGVMIGLGIYAQRSDYIEFARYAYLFGTTSLLSGVLNLSLSPNPRTPGIRFAHMSTRNLEEAQARLEFGEQALEHLARRSRQVRVIDASLSITAGVAVIPVFLHPKDYEFTEPLDYFIIVAAGISVITGIISLATRSDAERRWEAYEDLRERLDAEEDAGIVVQDDSRGLRLLGAGAAPVQGGGTAGFVFGF